MRKILALMLVLGLLLTGSYAYAAGGGAVPGTGTNKKVQDSVWKEHKAEIQALIQTVSQNHKEIAQLKTTDQEKLKQIRVAIKALRKDPNALTEDKIAQIKENMTLVRSDRMEIAGTTGLILTENLELQMHKRNRDWQGAMENLNNIIGVQQKRMDLLNKLNTDLDNLLTILKPSV